MCVIIVNNFLKAPNFLTFITNVSLAFLSLIPEISLCAEKKLDIMEFMNIQ